MYFQAIANNEKYEVNVNETPVGWKVSIKPEAGEWSHYSFTKTDYQYMDDTISFLFKDRSYLLDVTSSGVDYTVYTRGAFRSVKIFNEEKILHESLKSGGSLASGNRIDSEMPGKIVKVFVKNGQSVKSGDPLLVIEAMKMENEIRSDREVKIKTVHVKEGANVETGVPLITFES